MASNVIYICSIGLEEIGMLPTLFAGRFIKGIIVGIYSYIIPMLSTRFIQFGRLPLLKYTDRKELSIN